MTGGRKKTASVQMVLNAPLGLDRETRSLEIEVKYLDKEKAGERLATGNRRADGMRSQTKLGRPRRICSPP
jgi:hypothetical protein